MSHALDLLLADGVIDAVVGQLKTGKEAEVWLVEQHGQIVAAKVYKERHARNFRNNAGYREGRDLRNSRTRRAIAKGSKFGQQAAEDAWKSAEADSLYTLHAQGVRVPTPVMFYEGVLLMEVVVDAEGRPAPRLVESPPATAEAARELYVDLRGQVIRMLSADLIHGDLSAFNILMAWNGATIIDFPQTVAAARNNRAEQYFRRDLDNVRNFLAGVDPSLRGTWGDTEEIWTAYVRRELTPEFVPSGVVRHQRPPKQQGFREGERRGQNGQRDNGPRGGSGWRADARGPQQGGGAPGPRGQNGRDGRDRRDQNGGGFRDNSQREQHRGGAPGPHQQNGRDRRDRNGVGFRDNSQRDPRGGSPGAQQQKGRDRRGGGAPGPQQQNAGAGRDRRDQNGAGFRDNSQRDPHRNGGQRDNQQPGARGSGGNAERRAEPRRPGDPRFGSEQRRGNQRNDRGQKRPGPVVERLPLPLRAAPERPVEQRPDPQKRETGSGT